MSSIRQQLVDKLATRLAEIRIANGYATDIGLKVYPWRKAPMDAASCPGIIYADTEADTTADDATIGRWEHRLKVDVGVFVKGATAASVARSALADVVKAVYRTNGEYWDGIASYTELTTHEINLAQEGEVLCACQASFTITYTTLRGIL